MSPPYADVASAVLDAGEPDFLSNTFLRLTEMLGGSFFDDKDLSLHHAAALLRQAERTITEQRAHIDRLQRLSLTDELTALLNRRGFERELRRAFASLRRHGEPAIVLLADLDGFKLVNDTYGHQAGDFVLSEVARRLAAELRNTDVVARLGGDEFACILSHCNPGLIETQVLRLRQGVEDTPILWGGHRLAIGVSIGAAEMDIDHANGREALHLADAEMYAEKQRRRHC
ncbi:MAG: GGDEF domain-containing protein [Rhodospirillaceae bacterium]|nr:GGDEF domain-containing protein [Rhodospirillaceae bacterium]